MASAMTATDRKKLKVQELRDELAMRGLETDGVKAVLLERLEEAIAEEKKLEELPAAGEVDAQAEEAATTEKPPEETAEEPEAEEELPAAEEAGVAEEEPKPAPTAEETKPTAVAAVAPSDPDAEAEKRRKRAERFGISGCRREQEEGARSSLRSTGHGPGRGEEAAESRALRDPNSRERCREEGSSRAAL
eukprot:scaffold1318_cov388-Prasinococcus_capsulatus_cf.AAC.96